MQGLWREEAAAAISSVQRIPLFQLYLNPKGMVCVLRLVSNDPGRLMLKVTEGVLFHREIERPVSPNLPYYRVFVISQPAGPGTVKELNAAAKALERLIDATDTLRSWYCMCCLWLTRAHLDVQTVLQACWKTSTSNSHTFNSRAFKRGFLICVIVTAHLIAACIFFSGVSIYSNNMS